MGANKHFDGSSNTPGLRFAVWAPNAQSVDVVFGDPDSGYIADNGGGIDPAQPVVALSRSPDGIWEGGPQGTFEHFKSLPYMYRIVNAQGQIVYRTDIFSRVPDREGRCQSCQGCSWPGTVDTLDGTVSCSVVIDPDVVRQELRVDASGAAGSDPARRSSGPTEFTPGLPVPTRVDDLVIYELHVGSLGFGKHRPGRL